jgi:hypothetical protein
MSVKLLRRRSRALHKFMGCAALQFRLLVALFTVYVVWRLAGRLVSPSNRLLLGSTDVWTIALSTSRRRDTLHNSRSFLGATEPVRAR